MADGQKDDALDFEIEEEGAEIDQIEVVDDTPEEDRGREPMPEELVKELEADELEEYSEKVKIKLKQMKKVWHDERRAKEKEAREKAEALTAAQRLLDRNRQLENMLAQGEKELLGTHKEAAELELSAARAAYREAHEAGDTEKLITAQERLNKATLRAAQVESYKPTLQEVSSEVEIPQQSQQNQPRLDAKTVAWQERNTWYGTDSEMTAAALGLHQKLISERGVQFAGTDEYWSVVDTTMRRRFPEYFGDEVAEEKKPAARDQKAASVVAPASRSRSPKKIVLKQSQLAIAKKLGLTPEQYVRELMKLEA